MVKRISPTVDIECRFCGTPFRALRQNIIAGVTKSCGCLAVRNGHRVGLMSRIHGQWNSPTYRSWAHMWQRCTNPNNKVFKDYGGRGIKVDPKWRKFSNFLRDMGYRPTSTSIDRINNDKGYTKANCRWATRTQQQNNRRNKWERN